MLVILFLMALVSSASQADQLVSVTQASPKHQIVESEPASGTNETPIIFCESNGLTYAFYGDTILMGKGHVETSDHQTSEVRYNFIGWSQSQAVFELSGANYAINYFHGYSVDENGNGNGYRIFSSGLRIDGIESDIVCRLK